MIKIDYIVHGGSSFLGKSFIRFNNSKKNILVLARKSSNLSSLKNLSNLYIYRYENNLSVKLEVNKFDFSSSIFFEFSWYGVFGSERNDINQFKINIPLIISSVEFANYISCKHWVGVGSQAEYGNYNKTINENDICKPTTLYGKSKLFCSKLANELCLHYNINFSWLRLFSVYGPDDNQNWLIPYLINKMILGDTVNTTLGEQIWDYLYIDDVSRVFSKINVNESLGITNLSSSEKIRIKDLINIIKKITNSTSLINFGAIQYRKDQVMYMNGDNTKLKDNLSWTPKTSLEYGLLQTINNIRKVNEFK